MVDIMNARQLNRFSETEILRIFSDVCEAVAHMHSQTPPIIHRDLKVTNFISYHPLCEVHELNEMLISIFR
jgi:serine/threonine protein kinase